eukprot:CAMPEP_0202969850 /NCGR_PEP_ID=MMETSP1396-20130829/15729_1 /ASSEMBLY_ACC=CAM_ASM_000872 /TAXON_ID= /ORGANISM="Pseudokeronopsis sp., Strain Brazil" /LENGTH=49 /DNA_ID=CAMNT_0049697857 /DNA_START=1515 /DNA_END=1664 /DNA_ORIENTATION=+
MTEEAQPQIIVDSSGAVLTNLVKLKSVKKEMEAIYKGMIQVLFVETIDK